MLLTKHPERKSAYSTSPANVICLLMANTYCCDAFFAQGEVVRVAYRILQLERGKEFAAFHSPACSRTAWTDVARRTFDVGYPVFEINIRRVLG